MYKFDTLLYDWSSIVNTGSTNSLILVFFVLHFAANKKLSVQSIRERKKHVNYSLVKIKTHECLLLNHRKYRIAK